MSKALDMKTVSIGYLREDGDFAVLATFNNNDEHYSEEAFDKLVKATVLHIEANLDTQLKLLVLNRQDAPDYVDFYVEV